jgi:hypothetical protein
VLVLGGCDALTVQEQREATPAWESIHFKGAVHTAAHGSRLRSGPADLTVHAASGAAVARAAVQIDLEEQGRGTADLLFYTAALEAGDTFTAAALGGSGQVMGRIVHEGTGGGTNLVWADLGGYAPQAVTILFYNGEKLLHRRRVSLAEGAGDSLALATTSDEPDSWHEETIVNEDDGEETVLVADYEEQSSFPTGGDSLATMNAPTRAGTRAGTRAPVGHAELRPLGLGAVAAGRGLNTSSRGWPSRPQSPQSKGRASSLRCTHVALVIERGSRPESRAAGSIRLTRRGGASFTISDERFK